MSDSSHRDPIQEFANRIAELKRGFKHWVRPRGTPRNPADRRRPSIPSPGKRYHGLNVPILGMDTERAQTVRLYARSVLNYSR